MLQGAGRVGSFGVKNQKFAFFQKQLAPKFLFAYLATFWLFYNFFIPQIFRAQAHTVSTTQIDNNRHTGFCNGVGLGPQD